MNYNITEAVNYCCDGESVTWNNIEINDCTDEELAEIRAVVIRLYDVYCQREMKEEKERELQRQVKKAGGVKPDPYYQNERERTHP